MKRGSILLEFMLMVPVLLVLFGATMLWMDISLGKMYIQEANRNLAWLTKDRYDDGKIKSALYDSAREPYELRNKVEKNFGGAGYMWKYTGGTTNAWGFVLGKGDFIKGVQRLDADEKCDWYAMTSGNMNLKMAHLSGVYMGAVALGSVLQPDGEMKHLYASAYDFTRSRMASGSNDVVALSFNPEAVVIHRAYDNERREDVNKPNGLIEKDILLNNWPTDGMDWYDITGELGGIIDDGGGGESVSPGGGGEEDEPARDLFLGGRRLW